VAVAAVIYTVHAPNMAAAADIIDSYRARTPEAQLAAFERALARNSFAQQEIVEQFAQQAMNIARAEGVPDELRQRFVTRAEEEIVKFIAQKPNDARLHVFAGTFYRFMGDQQNAAIQMDQARALSPRKQGIIAQQGIIALTLGEYERARDLFKESYDLATDNLEAKEYYAASLFYTSQGDEAKALITDEPTRTRFAQSQFLISAAGQAGDQAFLAELYETRTKLTPGDAQNWASLAFLYYQLGDNETALARLAEGARNAPEFASLAACVRDNIMSGREPQVGCQ